MRIFSCFYFVQPDCIRAFRLKSGLQSGLFLPAGCVLRQRIINGQCGSISTASDSVAVPTVSVHTFTVPHHAAQLAGYPLTGVPSAVQFLEMLYNALVRG